MIRILFRLLAIGALVIALLSTTSQAQSHDEEIEELKKQIGELQRRNQEEIQQLRKRIEALETLRTGQEEKSGI